MTLSIPTCISFQIDVPSEFMQYPYVLVGAGGFKQNGIQLTDNTGVNISQYNPYLNEMTVLYWMAKNYSSLSNPDYVGLAHYRRRLLHEDYMLQSNTIVCHAENYKIPIYKHYCIYHVKSDIDYVVNMIQKNFSSQMFRLFVDFLNQTYAFERNLFIMPKNKFFEYSDFICKCIDILISDLFQHSDIAYRDRYQKRAMGFLCERLTSFWIYSQMVQSKSTLILAQEQSFELDSPYQRESI